jgi:predicted molibdopterin-dependent oxidoreductase YjgC
LSAPVAILRRIDGAPRETVSFELDGRPCTAQAGDTVLTAILTQSTHLRAAEFSGMPRAGFCLMGACQDCWVQLVDGERLRACSSFIEPGMRVRTGVPR